MKQQAVLVLLALLALSVAVVAYWDAEGNCSPDGFTDLRGWETSDWCYWVITEGCIMNDYVRKECDKILRDQWPFLDELMRLSKEVKELKECLCIKKQETAVVMQNGLVQESAHALADTQEVKEDA